MEILNKYFEDNYPDFTPNTIDKLLFIGDVSLGALEYRPAYANVEDESLGIKLQELRTHKKELLRTKDYNSVRNLVSLYKSFSPLAGARSKLLLNYHPSTESFSIGKACIDEIAIILKLDETQSSIKSIDTKVEWIYSQVAKKVGLNMFETYLFKDEDGFSHFGAQRFDVDENGERFHTISLSGLLNVDKAQRIDLKEFLEIGKSILFLPKENLEEIFRRIVFNYVYNNNDDHLKNHEFLMSKDGTWRLSPLFDVTFNSKIGSRYMRTKINSKNSDKATLDDFAVIAKEYKIKNYEAIMREVQDAKKLLTQLITSMISDEYYDVDRENILDVNFLIQ